MPSTRTPGITVTAAGHRIIDKEHRGVQIYVRLGPISDEEAEKRLGAELSRVDSELQRRAHSRPRFADCAARYLAESQHKRSVDVVAWHVRLLGPCRSARTAALRAVRRASGLSLSSANAHW